MKNERRADDKRVPLRTGAPGLAPMTGCSIIRAMHGIRSEGAGIVRLLTVACLAVGGMAFVEDELLRTGDLRGDAGFLRCQQLGAGLVLRGAHHAGGF